MKKEYTKPSMTVTCYDSMNVTNGLTRSGTVIGVGSTGNYSSQSYKVTQLN